MNEASEKKHENFFKFGLYLNTEPISERIFSADIYNPVVRYSVDVRDKLSEIISKLCKTLSRKNLSYNVGEYNNLNTYRDFLKSDIKKIYPNKLDVPKLVKFTKGNSPQEFLGVVFTLGLYINNHPIVERFFGVEDYNPSARFSNELSDVIGNITEDIQQHLKRTDIRHMWDDNEIITTYGLNIGHIRELPKEKRQNLLRNCKNYDFIRRIRSEFKVASGGDGEEELEVKEII